MIAPLSGFSDLASGLRWRASGAILMIWAYYDESGEYADKKLINMSMGGVVSTREKWDSFASLWNSALSAEGLSYFHMTDFEAWRPPYDFKLPTGERDKERHNRLLTALLEIIVDHSEQLAGFAAGNLISQDRRRAHHLAMEDCILAAITHAVHDLWARYQEPINLVFAKQKHFSFQAIAKCVELYNWGAGIGRIGAVVWAEPQSCEPLQAADLLAYEMSKIQREGRPTRYPFVHLRDEAQRRDIPLTLKWGPFTRISDRVAARMKGEQPA